MRTLRPVTVHTTFPAGGQRLLSAESAVAMRTLATKGEKLITGLLAVSVVRLRVGRMRLVRLQSRRPADLAA